ncbi:hypothetical protein O6H91_07G088100 [Diphasiastrum complanatum]|nr:hypothetical protein O6H91_07G088100 [Diphasiastrum complanatum]
MVLRKAYNSVAASLPKGFSTDDAWHASRNCSVLHQKLQAIANAEPLIVDEPRKPWLTLKQNIKNIVYLSNMIDISYHKRHIYVDVGARNYGSSIGGWFKKRYPKQNQTFKIFAIEADTSFESGYRNRKDVTLLPYAAWLQNESLMFGDSRTGDPSFKGAGMGRIQPVVQITGNLEDGKSSTYSKETQHHFKSVQGMDFSAWLLRTVSPHDYTVMKMDVEGTEFDLLPKMFDTGAICLVDELFLECHYNRWQRCCPERTGKYEKTYSDCLQLFETLRTRGVLVHQWW